MPNAKPTKEALPPAVIERKIYLLRRQKVMRDSDLAALYGVETKQLNKAVKRNAERFPTDFMYQLPPAAARALRYQMATTHGDKPGRPPLPALWLYSGGRSHALLGPQESAGGQGQYRHHAGRMLAVIYSR